MKRRPHIKIELTSDQVSQLRQFWFELDGQDLGMLLGQPNFLEDTLTVSYFTPAEAKVIKATRQDLDEMAGLARGK